MDCREFRDNHSSYIDQRLSGDEEAEMRRHAQECVRCARHDSSVRRSLILVRSLPSIEPSPDFQARLNARLRALPPTPVVSRPPLRSFAAIAASVTLIAYLAAELLLRGTPAALELPPVVASMPETGNNSQVATPALVATVPTGMSVFPALMVASQSVHFVAAELSTER